MDSLVKLDEAWVLFHANKHYFVDVEVRKHFNIPKLHSMQHYVAAIISRGSADGFSTESPKRLHIDFAKNVYRATNRKNYIKQMTMKKKKMTTNLTALINPAVLVMLSPRNPLIRALASPPLSPILVLSTFFSIFIHSFAHRHTPLAQLPHQHSTPNYLSTSVSRSDSHLHLK
jgi:hypothetical protein